MHLELLELNRYRLDEDLTYRELGDRIGIPYRTLHTLLTRPNAQMHDRTLHKIRRFLTSVTRKSSRRTAQQVPA